MFPVLCETLLSATSCFPHFILFESSSRLLGQESHAIGGNECMQAADWWAILGWLWRETERGNGGKRPVDGLAGTQWTSRFGWGVQTSAARPVVISETCQHDQRSSGVHESVQVYSETVANSALCTTSFIFTAALIQPDSISIMTVQDIFSYI